MYDLQNSQAGPVHPALHLHLPVILSHSPLCMQRQCLRQPAPQRPGGHSEREREISRERERGIGREKKRKRKRKRVNQIER